MMRDFCLQMYVLGGDGRTPVRVHDLQQWGEFLTGADRLIAMSGNEHVYVSTVFLGLDHNYLGEGGPILFETMVFGGPFDHEQERYKTWAEAEAGHKQWTDRVFRKEGQPCQKSGSEPSSTSKPSRQE
jgi:hypothetical protein